MLKKPSSKERTFKEKKPVLNAMLLLLIKIVTVAIIVVSIFTFIFGVTRIDDMGMVPNINPSDMVIYYRLDKNFAIGETLVFEYKGRTYAGRIVAMPGDTVEIDSDGLKVNGNSQYEPKIYKETEAFVDGAKYPVKLEENEYFVLGDNRDKTVDSRLFGPMKKENIGGKIFTLIRGRGI